MNEAVIDQMYRLIIQGRLEELENITSPEEAVHIRSMICTASKGAIGSIIDLEKIKARAPWVTSLFTGPRIYFLSANTTLQNAITGNSKVLLDWSFSFDSNVAEKVRAYVNHEDINPTDLERVIELIKIKKEYSLQTDLIPFLFENLRLARENDRNERPLNTIIAFKKLDYLDWNAFDTDPSKPKFDCDEPEMVKISHQTYESLINNAEVKNRENKALFTQAILFELAILWLSEEHTAEKAFEKLIDFCVLSLRKLPKYELMLAWKFLKSPGEIRFFGPLNGISKKITKDLRGMAWDISHMRTLETLATQSRNGSFYIPFFVSFDEKFSEILKESQIIALLMDDRLKRMQTIFNGELAFQHTLISCFSEKTAREMTPAQSESRRRSQISTSELEHILNAQTRMVEALAEKARAKRLKQ